MSSASIAIPKPTLVIPGFDELPEPIQQIIDRLSTPFPIEDVKVRPGAVRRDGSAALCLAYSDWWTGYLPRLNDEVGPNNWRITLQPWGNDQIIAHLSAFGGLIEKESSGSAKGEANGAQEAEVQAKKRVSAEGLMLGLYFYFLPKVWGKGERTGKDFTFADGEEQRCVYEMYARAGLLSRATPAIAIPKPTPTEATVRVPLPTTPATTTPHSSSIITSKAATGSDKTTRARAALAEAERSSGVRSATVGHADQTNGTTSVASASEPQLGLIIRLINGLLDADAHNADAINAIGAGVRVPDLATRRDKQALRALATPLPKTSAARLIDALKAIGTPAHAA